MKTSKKALALALAAAMAFTGIPVTDAEAASTAKLSATKATIYVGGSKTVSVKAPSTWKSVAISTVSSNKKSVATVKKASSKSFKVTAVKAGTAKVTVKVSYKTSTKKNAKKYTKTLAFTANVKSTTLTAKPGKSTLYIGETTKVTAKAVPSSAKITYATGNKKIATVDSKGNIKAVKAGKVTIAAYAKYGTKKVRKAFTITVKEPAVTATLENSTLAVGEKATLKVTKTPSGATLAFKSSDDTVATVSETGEITAVKAGTATITTTLTYKGTTKEVTTDVTVKEAVAALSAVKQTASNAFTAEFTADASKTITKDDIKVIAADGSSELAVKSVEYSADGKSAVVTLFGNFVNATTYTVNCKDAKVELAAKVGAVARVEISTASAEQNVETPIAFTLIDADNIDVTPSVSIDTTCIVTATGDYTALNNNKASKASLTMNTVGAKADVTVTYNSNVSGAQDVVGTATVTCVDTKVTQGTKLFATKAKTTGNDVNNNSSCAKFYLGLSDAEVSVPVGSSLSTSAKALYFCAKDAKGDVISYDTYEVESSNDDVASATVNNGYDSGKFVSIDVTGNSVGTAQINVKASKNGKATYYTIPVSVTTVAEAATMEVEVTRPTMSDVDDSDYSGLIKAQLYDKDHHPVTGSYAYKAVTEDKNKAFKVDSSTGEVTAAGAEAKTYTIEVTGSDNNNNAKTFTKRVNVTVKALPEDKTKLDLVYQIELSSNAIDENPSNRSDDSVTAKLYATYNGLFAGYVRADSDSEYGVNIANGNVTGSATTMISGVTVGAKFGTKTFAADPDKGLVTSAEPALISDAAANIFSAVTVGAVTYDVATKSSNQLAKTGLYTIEFSYTQNEKVASKTRTVTVSNSVFVPSVTVTTRTIDSFNNDDVVAALKTNVDMNNKESDHKSISNPSPSYTSGDKWTVKTVDVVDNYTDGNWTFTVPINATFKTE